MIGLDRRQYEYIGRLPPEASEPLRLAETHGRKAYLYGTSVLDLLLGLPMGQIRILTDDPELLNRTDTDPLTGRPIDILTSMPCTALALHCSADGIIRDPFGALPALARKSIIPSPHTDWKGPGGTQLCLLALASRYGLKLGRSTSNRIRSSGIVAEKDPAIREWLTLFLSGQDAADLMERYDTFFMRLIPELRPCRGLMCNPARHAYDVYGHIARSVTACRIDDPIAKLALMLHDIGKPLAAEPSPDGTRFPGHAIAGRDAADIILDRMGYPTAFRHAVLDMILYHDRPIPPNETGLTEWLRHVGPDGLARLMEVKRADIMAHSGQTRQRLIRQWEDTRRYLYAKGIHIAPEKEE